MDFSAKRHINLLEMKSLLRLGVRLARSPRSMRVVNFVDSNVIRCAASKGRTSSRALAPLIKRFGATCVAAGLYFTLPFVPTRLNTSDDPTRDREVRSAWRTCCLDELTEEDCHALCTMPKLRRWASNWLRVVLCILDFRGAALVSPHRRLHGLQWTSPRLIPDLPWASHALCHHMDFDSTMGYPGEGPFWVLFLIFLAPCCLSCLVPPCLVLFLVTLVGRSEAMIAPRTPGDWSRQATRRNRPPLPQGRPVTQLTAGNRERLLADLLRWSDMCGLNLRTLLENPLLHIERINAILQMYGRRLYDAGKTYNIYVESVNSIASFKPVLKRQLQPAWDLAFAWVREERPIHHIAMPWQVLLAMLSVALGWGWLEMAGLLALGWGALLRTSEMTNSLRKDLLLPSDTLGTNKFALLSLLEPKTRFVAARHQSAKLDIGDLLAVVEMAFADFKPHQKLWSFSSATFRLRFKDILRALSLQTGVFQGSKTLDAGSLRPGGATWQLQCTEDSEFVRRRGRWVNAKVMEIYIQEIGSVQFLAQMTTSQRERVIALAELFPTLLKRAACLKRAFIPCSAWYTLLSSDEP